MRKKLIVLTTILGLIAFSGVAAAQEHEPEDTEETGDTTFNYGFDEDNGVFIWGSSPSDGEIDCTLENGPIEATYGSGDGGLLIEDLTYLEGDDAGNTVVFDPTEEGGAPLEYDPANEDCQLTAGEVAGPQGQINHGMFLKTFNALFDGKARGCMVRHIAQSDLGKGDQQVQPDVDPEADGVEPGDTGEVDFETVMTDCLHGPDDAEVEAQGNGKGRPDRVTQMLEEKHGNDDSGRRGPPDHAGGKGPKD